MAPITKIAMDWTDFDGDSQATLSLNLGTVYPDSFGIALESLNFAYRELC